MLNWILTLVLLCSAVGSVRSCDWLRIYGDLSNDSMSLLDQMPEEKLVFISDSLIQISQLYHHENLSSVPWNQNKTDLFLLTMDRQAREMNSCVTANKLRAKRTHTEADTQTHLKLSHYYKKLFRSTVHKMGGSVASWELIRKESKVHLEMLDLLQVTIPRPAKSG
ncbi:hypothetical protein NHX12_032379 [Muraenolepis orangiensis]|uniref:Uncharacterized protein n=1 Tax=Muraenolepis orangiensis TaxID=630683 RepID=A0A9Q0E8U5_9TELE|nr:hypothetical protein NHX12_032379 [Muraenolepis orangiensis]